MTSFNYNYLAEFRREQLTAIVADSNRVISNLQPQYEKIKDRAPNDPDLLRIVHDIEHLKDLRDAAQTELDRR